MKKVWVILLIVLVLVLGYLGRHRLKAMLGGSSTQAPASQTTIPTSQASPGSASSSAMAKIDLVTTKTDPAKGTYLADAKGMSLYTFDKDTAGVSNCNDNCASVWPPYLSKGPANLPTGFIIITRKDGSSQYTYQGKPLYYYAKDAKAGDTLGDGVGGVWHLAKP